MSSARLAIGGLAMHLEGDASVEQAMALPGMGAFALHVNAEPAIVIALDAVLPMPPMQFLHRFEILDGAGECCFGVDAEGAYHYRFGDAEEVCFDPRNSRQASITPMDGESKLRFALWLAYNMTAVGFGRMPVHSSVVVCEDRAVMCLGESGTGKSTHTRLWLENIPGTHLLNDDSPILAASHDGPAIVYGSPWSGKTHCYRQERYPLAALLRLEQRPENSIRRLGTIESFAALQPSCPPSMAHDERCLDLVVRFVSAVISHTPTYRLGCLPDADAARLSHSTIYGN